MKESIILKYIWLLSGNFMIAILLAACNGSNIIPDNPDEEIEIIPERSITFSLGTATRALPVTQLRGESFGVKAYILDNLWAAAGYNAKPDTDWNNVRIDCSVRMPLSSHGWIINTTHFSVIIRIIPPV